MELLRKMKEYQAAALASVGKFLGVNRWCIHSEVSEG
jgi:hypothetical protein